MKKKHPLSCMVLAVFFCLSSVAIGEELSAEDNAPELLNRAKSWIEDSTPARVGFSVSIAGANVDVYVNRDISLDDVTFDPDTTVMRIKGKLRYKTGPRAAISASVGSGFDIRYNVSTSDLEGVTLTLKKDPIPKISINLTPIKQALDGDVAKLLELIPNGGLVRRKIWSEYDSRKKHFQDKYGKENVYFATSDFVRWASPETAGKWIVALIASGGSASNTIAAEARTKVRRESVHILRWLEGRVGNRANSVLDSLLQGSPPQLPELKLVWQRVQYRSQVVIGGQALPKTPPIPHAAFVLIWKTPTSPSVTFDNQPCDEIEDSGLRPKWIISARYAIGPTGCRIIFVGPGGACARGGIKVDDVITKAGNLSLGSNDWTTDKLVRALKASNGAHLEIEYLRDGVTHHTTLTLDPAP